MDYSQEYVQKLFDENRYLKADRMMLFSKNVELHKENEDLRKSIEAYDRMLRANNKEGSDS